MAKTIKQVNFLNIKQLKKNNKFYLYDSTMQIAINHEWQKGFGTLEEAEDIAKALQMSGSFEGCAPHYITIS